MNLYINSIKNSNGNYIDIVDVSEYAENDELYNSKELLKASNSDSFDWNDA